MTMCPGSTAIGACSAWTPTTGSRASVRRRDPSTPGPARSARPGTTRSGSRAWTRSRRRPASRSSSGRASTGWSRRWPRWTPDRRAHRVPAGSGARGPGAGCRRLDGQAPRGSHQRPRGRGARAGPAAREAGRAGRHHLGGARGAGAPGGRRLRRSAGPPDARPDTRCRRRRPASACIVELWSAISVSLMLLLIVGLIWFHAVPWWGALLIGVVGYTFIEALFRRRLTIPHPAHVAVPGRSSPRASCCGSSGSRPCSRASWPSRS